MEFGSPGGRDAGEYNGVGCFEIPLIFVMQNVFLFGTNPFDRV